MASGVVSPTFEERRSCEKKATLSACFGAMGDVTLTDSAIIILFAQMLGAGDMFSMLTTSLLPLFNGICIIPMAWLASRIGYQKLIVRICMVSAFAYYMVVASPFLGGGRISVGIMIGMIAAACPLPDTITKLISVFAIYIAGAIKKLGV